MKHQNYHTLLKAYQTLFCVKYSVTPEMLNELKIGMVRSAYKKMAMKSHPDRAVLLGVHRNILEKKFKEVNEAYSLLASLIEKGPASSSAGSASPWQKSRPYHENTGGKSKAEAHGNRNRKSRSWKGWHRHGNDARGSGSETHDSTNQGRQESRQNFKEGSYARPMYMFFPGEELMLGQFLYYSGHISLKNLVTAIQWQRGQRPSFGKIAMDWKILRHDDIITILRNRHPREKFGQCSVRLGLVSSFQYRAVLSKQRNLQSPIGEYFIREGILSKEEMDEMQRRLLQHNMNVRENKERRS